jgi:FkbM family methyltransferase
MVSVEANPALIDHILALHARNGLADLIEVRHGIVAADPASPAETRFFIAGNFLGSGLAPGKAAKARPVTVPVLRYGDLKAGFPHDTIVMDIEGAEREFLSHADLAGVETVILEVHRSLYGRDGMRDIRRAFARSGFAMEAETSQPGVHVYRRAAPAGSGPVPDPCP